MRRGKILVAVAAFALLLTGCADPGQPMDPAPVGPVHRPEPANVGGPDPDKGAGTPNDCNALASLAPSGLSVPAGSTMDEIRKRGRLIAGVDQTNYGFGFLNPATGQLEGFDIDMAKQVAKAIFGDPNAIQFKALTSEQRVPALQTGQVDIVARTMTINCARRKDIEFSSVYYIAGQRVLVDKRSTAQSLNDLGGQRVCAARGSTPLDYLAKAPSKPVPVSVENWSDCLVMLQQGQVAAVSTDDVILSGMARQDPTTKLIGDRLTQEPYGIGIPKDNQDMVRFVNAVLEDARREQWQVSYDRYLAAALGPASPPSPQYK